MWEGWEGWKWINKKIHNKKRELEKPLIEKIFEINKKEMKN